MEHFMEAFFDNLPKMVVLTTLFALLGFLILVCQKITKRIRKEDLKAYRVYERDEDVTEDDSGELVCPKCIEPSELAELGPRGFVTRKYLERDADTMFFCGRCKKRIA